MNTLWEMAVHLSLVMFLVVSFLCCPFSHEMSWMRSGTELSQFLRNFPTYSNKMVLNIVLDIQI